MTIVARIVAGIAGAVLAAGGVVAGTQVSTAPSTATVLASGADGDYTGYCGVEFHAIKDLQDGSVPGSPIDSTVSALTKLPVDTSLSSSAPRSSTEKKVFRVEATLLGTKGEGDSDIHLLLEDPTSSATMGAEIPAGPCLSGSADAPMIEAARAALIASYGLPPTSGYSSLNVCVDVTGVAFFDSTHGQADVAPNAIELHPVLAISPCGSTSPPPPVTTGTQPPDTGPVTTTATTATQKTSTSCQRWPGRHYFYGHWHRYCRSYFFTTP